MNYKTILACAALLTGMVFFNGRLNAAVESDIVGYTTVTMEAGNWYAVGNPFQALDGSETYKVMDLFGTGFSNGDLLYIFNPKTSAFSYTLEWVTVNGQSGWGNSFLEILDNPEVEAGSGVLIKKVTAGAVSLSGKVEAVSSKMNGGEWAYLVLQYPEKKKLTELTWTGFENGDYLYILNPKTNAFSITLEWVTIGGQSGWGNSFLEVLDTTTTIDVGNAFLINKKSAGEGSVAL